jgi:hypothetical protein
MSIRLKKPYKIIQPKHKKYEAHYLIPADKSLVVPLQVLGEEVSCDVRWENDNGELKAIHNIIFIKDNLIPLNPMIDDKLYSLWLHYYPELKDQ